jgi:hypothetical protein
MEGMDGRDGREEKVGWKGRGGWKGRRAEGGDGTTYEFKPSKSSLLVDGFF